MTITALIQLDLGLGSGTCEGWTTVASSHVAQIVVTASPGHEMDARRLFDALRLAMRAAGARHETPACGGSLPFQALGCQAIVQPGPVRRILVWVADRVATPPPVDPTLAHWDAVLPLLSAGTSAHHLPAALRNVVAPSVHPGQIEATVPDVLALAGIISDGFRIFVSYRWDDCQAFAEQLFDALSKQQFDVYLDRFRTAPGQNFVERIQHELGDKACVVLLDSAHVDQSVWVRAEHAVARQHRLGLFAIDVPGGQQHFPTIARRIDLRAAATSTTFGRDTRLPGHVVTQAVDAIRADYLAETARRPRYQRQILRSAARVARVPVHLEANGLASVGTAPRYLVSAQARPPQTRHFRQLETAARAAGARPVMVGLLDDQLTPDRIDCDWLATRIGGAAIDERRLLRAFRLMRRGQL